MVMTKWAMIFTNRWKRVSSAFPRPVPFFASQNTSTITIRSQDIPAANCEQSGLLENWLEKIYIRQRIQTPSIVLRREVYERLGGFDQRLTAFEDWEMWVRTAVCFPFGFNADCTARLSRLYTRTRRTKASLVANVREIQKQALEIVDSYVPDAVKRECGSLRAREVAYYLTRCLPIAIRHRRPLAWLRLCGHIASHSLHPRVWYYAFRCSLQESKS